MSEFASHTRETIKYAGNAVELALLARVEELERERDGLLGWREDFEATLIEHDAASDVHDSMDKVERLCHDSTRLSTATGLVREAPVYGGNIASNEWREKRAAFLASCAEGEGES